MSENCLVVVADGVRARILTLEEAASPTESGPFLVEQRDLVNPESDVKGRDLWSDVKTGMGRESGGAPTHGYDDHRDEHEDEFKRRFARRIVDEALSAARARGAVRLIVAAEKQMLGFLRPALAHAPKNEMEVCEVAKDLSKLSVGELQERLSGEKLLPPRLPPQAQRGNTRS